MRYKFIPGEKVILKERKKAGIKLQASGPYTFIRYSSPLMLVGILETDSKVRFTASTAHIAPAIRPMKRKNTRINGSEKTKEARVEPEESHNGSNLEDVLNPVIEEVESSAPKPPAEPTLMIDPLDEDPEKTLAGIPED